MLRSCSSTESAMAVTCRVFAPVQRTKYSVKDATWRRSNMAMSVAFFSPAARAAIMIASSGSTVCGCCVLFALRPIYLPPVKFIFLYVVEDGRRDIIFYRSALAYHTPDLRRRDVSLHVIRQKNLRLLRPAF